MSTDGKTLRPVASLFRYPEQKRGSFSFKLTAVPWKFCCLIQKTAKHGWKNLQSDITYTIYTLLYYLFTWTKKKKKSDLINIFIFTIQHILKDSCLRFGPLDFWKPDVQFFFIEYHRLVWVIYIKEVTTGLYRLHKNHCDFKYILLCI